MAGDNSGDTNDGFRIQSLCQPGAPVYWQEEYAHRPYLHHQRIHEVDMSLNRALPT